VFKIFDKDGDGRISMRELEEAFESSTTDYTREELDKIMHAMDSDKDEMLDINEWRAAALICST
jgi:Ca2+-binding EF-hand superfamily protein